MMIQIDTLYLRELVYEMMRNLDDGKYVNSSSVCRGMLNAEQTLALDTLINRIEEVAE